MVFAIQAPVAVVLPLFAILAFVLPLSILLVSILLVATNYFLRLFQYLIDLKRLSYFYGVYQ
jgi:hypothetical protein